MAPPEPRDGCPRLSLTLFMGLRRVTSCNNRHNAACNTRVITGTTVLQEEFLHLFVVMYACMERAEDFNDDVSAVYHTNRLRAMPCCTM